MKERQAKRAGAVGGGVLAALAFCEEWSVHPHGTASHGPITGLAVLLGGFIAGGGTGWFLAAVSAKTATWATVVISVAGLLLTAANNGFSGGHLGTELLAYGLGVGSLVVSSLASMWWPVVDEVWNGPRTPHHYEQPHDELRPPHPAEVPGTRSPLGVRPRFIAARIPPHAARGPRFTPHPPGDTRPD